MAEAGTRNHIWERDNIGENIVNFYLWFGFFAFFPLFSIFNGEVIMPQTLSATIANPVHSALNELPQNALQELYDFAEFLLSKHKSTEKKHPTFGCMKGMLKYMSDDFNEPLEV